MKSTIKKWIQRFEIVLLRIGIIRDASRQCQMILMHQFSEGAKSGNKPAKLEDVGFNVYSVTYEDGILLYIFSVIGMTNRKVVDIGAGSIRGSNVSNLIINHGFIGLLMDGNRKNIEISRDFYTRHPETKLFPPKLVSGFVVRENVNQLLEDNGFRGEIDLLCIDIDGIDYWIWKAIEVIQPRVVVVEYQDILGPDRVWTVPYKPDFNARDYPENNVHTNYCGASLGAFVKLSRERGYRLVGWSKGGWNAFFVKNEIGSGVLPEIPIKNCFMNEWNKIGMETRFPLIKNMKWEEV